MKKYSNGLHLIFLFVLFIPINLLAQTWIITEADNSVTYIGQGWIKSVTGDMEDMEDMDDMGDMDDIEEASITSLYSLRSNIWIMINENEMTYAKGSSDDFCVGMKSIYEEVYKGMAAMIAQEKAKPAPKVSVQKSGGESIAGYSTSKYSISVDGELFEEKWISNDEALKSLIPAMNEAYKNVSKLVSCGVPDEVFIRNSPEFSPQYQEVEQAGVELRSVRYEFGSAMRETDVISLENEDLSAEEFEVPGDYNEIGIKEFLASMSGM